MISSQPGSTIAHRDDTKSLESHKIPTFKNRLIKAYDFLAYVVNRQAMNLRTWVARARKSRRLSGEVRSILVVRLASLGDVVRSTAVLESLKQHHPEAMIDFLTADGMRPVLENNPRLRRVYGLSELDRIGCYDWMINLQVSDPPESFLRSSGRTYDDVLRHLSSRVGSRFISGRHVYNHEMVPSHTDILSCRTEMEELFRVALLPYCDEVVDQTRIDVQRDPQVLSELGIASGTPYVAIFLGSASTGGHDEGFRTYSMRYLRQLVAAMEAVHTVVVFGTSDARTATEREDYLRLLEAHPRVIDLVDKTALPQLFQVLAAADLVIANDSGPLHIALSLRVPTIGLFVNTAQYRISPVLQTDRYILLNSFDPCFAYNYRWKFHCQACEDKHYQMYGCNLRSFDQKLDLLAVEKVVAAAQVLLGVQRSSGHKAPTDQPVPQQ